MESWELETYERLRNDPSHAQAFGQKSIERSYEDLLPALFPRALRSDFGDFHHRFWGWFWAIELDKPVERPFAALWFRGAAKSTSFEMAIAAAAARKTRRHVLYISGAHAQAYQRIAAIEAKLRSDEMQSMYPGVGRPMRSKESGSTKGWRQDYLYTESGFVVYGLGLDAAMRGVKAPDDFRPDLVVFDDIDDLKDSLPVVKTKLDKIEQNILMAMDLKNGAVMFGQNLIHSDSIASQLLDGRAGILANAIIDGPVRAFEGLEYREENYQDEHGRMRRRDRLTAGTPNWVGFTLEDAQRMVDNATLDSFLRESQHEIDRPVDGASFPMYDERYTVITWSMFGEKFGNLALDSKRIQPAYRIPPVGYIAHYQDIGGTIEHPNGNIWAWRPEFGMPLDDSIFVYRELCIPEWPEPRTLDASSIDIGRKIHELEGPWMEYLQMHHRGISHEANNEVRNYLKDLPLVGLKPLRFTQWNAHKTGGMDLLRSYMTVIDRDRPHPFGRPLMGRPRIYLVVDDDQGRYENGRVQPGWNERGLVRLRAEIVKHTYAKLQNPREKIFDDLVDPLRKLFEVFAVPAAKPSPEDEIKAMLPEAYRPGASEEAVAVLTEAQRQALPMTSYYMYHNAKAQYESQQHSGPRQEGYYERQARLRNGGGRR